MTTTSWKEKLLRGQVIPAHPLALDAERRFDERRQRALTRYYLAAGAGGLAVGVHTTQFEIHDPRVGLYHPVLELAAEVMQKEAPDQSLVKVAGLVGATAQAVGEAELARGLGYHAGLLSLAALPEASDSELIDHARRVAAVIPLFGFYLQPAVGGRRLSYDFWRRFVEIPELAAIKVAPFDRYETLSVARAVAESGREIALYTGNDDNILGDLLTPFQFPGCSPVFFRGGLLGQWAVWTRRAVEIVQIVKNVLAGGKPVPQRLLRFNAQWTDANRAIFDAANNFQGCIPGINEVLRRQGLLAGRWCLDPSLDLSPGQAEQIDRVTAGYPQLTDDDFVRENLDDWLKP